MNQSKLILFGATGDLVKAKIMPALNALGIAPLSYGRKDVADANYIKGELNEIADKIKDVGITHAYVALPPMYFDLVLRQLAMLSTIPRIALEKPFGTSYVDAERLVMLIKELGLENNVYLVDHYLGKPALIDSQNLEIDTVGQIAIDVFETQNVVTRGAFYDAVGTIKDFVQNHIMVIIGTLLKESSRKEVLEKLVYKQGSILIAQYEGFKDALGVAPDSMTETFVSCVFVYDSKIEIKVRVGKAMHEAKAIAVIKYKEGNEEEIIIQSPVNPYEAILNDFVSDQSAFKLSFEEALRSWQIAEQVIAAKSGMQPVIYPQGADPETITAS